jgi:endonuclease YncB( thermonuclease family)
VSGPPPGPRRHVRRLARPDSYNVPERRRQLGRVMLMLGALIALAFLGSALVGRIDRESAGPLRETLFGWEYSAGIEALTPVTVTRVLDGDTLEVSASGELLRVRLFGIDAPERGEACADVATERLRRLARERVRLLHDARLTDDGGRELRYVFTPEGISIDAQLIVEGLATAWRRDGALRDALVALEDDAATPACHASAGGRPTRAFGSTRGAAASASVPLDPGAAALS